MEKQQDHSLLSLLKELKFLIDQSLKSKLNRGDYAMPQAMIMSNLADKGKMKILF